MSSETHHECVVCEELTTDALEPCGHILCHVCFSKWVIRHRTCPMCRGNVACDIPDGEETLTEASSRSNEFFLSFIPFDVWLANDVLRQHSVIPNNAPPNRHLHLRRGVPACFTYDYHQQGYKVLGVKPYMRAALLFLITSGISWRPGDIITHVNGVRCTPSNIIHFERRSLVTRCHILSREWFSGL